MQPHCPRARQPEDLFDAQVLFQYGFDSGLVQLRVPPRRKQAAFRHHQGPFPVSVNASAFQDEGVRVEDLIPKPCGKAFCRRVILVPARVKTVHFAAPGVEAPVYGETGAIIRKHEGRPHVPGPGIVRFHLNKGKSCRHSGGCLRRLRKLLLQPLPCCRQCLLTHQEKDLFHLQELRNDLRKGGFRS